MRQQILDLQRTLRDLRCGVALKLGVVYEGDAPLIGACAALRDERNTLTEHNRWLQTTLHKFRQSVADSLCVELAEDSKLLSACTDERSKRADTTRALELERGKRLEYAGRIWQILSILHIDHAKEWREQTIEANKIYLASKNCPKTEPSEAQHLTYKVHDDGAYWHVSADKIDDKRFKKVKIPDAIDFIEYKTHLETVLGYKERK